MSMLRDHRTKMVGELVCLFLTVPLMVVMGCSPRTNGLVREGSKGPQVTAAVLESDGHDDRLRFEDFVALQRFKQWRLTARNQESSGSQEPEPERAPEPGPAQNQVHEETDPLAFVGPDPQASIDVQEAVEIPAGMELNAVFDLRCLAGLSTARERGQIASQIFIEPTLLEKSDSHRSALRKKYLHSVTWSVPESLNWKKLLTIVQEEPCLHMLTPDVEMELLSASSDPLVGRQQHLDFIRMPRTLERLNRALATASPSVIAIIDTGVDLSHPDLAPNAWWNPREIPNNGIDDDHNGYVDDINGYDFGDRVGASGPKNTSLYFKHATHVAGLASARLGNGLGGSGVFGVAKIMSLNVFGSKRNAKVSSLENAIRYAVDNGAKVINLSIGGNQYSRSMEATLRYAIRRGVVIVAASGNNGIELSANRRSSRYLTPAALGSSMAGMITVTSVDVSSGRLSSFSNFSLFLVELGAPGAFQSVEYSDGLYSTFPGGSYGWLAGTSMAAPVVSGAAALVQAWLVASGYNPHPALVEKILIEGSRESDQLIGFTRNSRLLDLDRLATYLEQKYP